MVNRLIKILPGATFLIVGCILATSFSGDWLFDSELLHGFLEATGALFALVIIFLFLQSNSKKT